MPHPPEEIREAYRRYVATRDRIEAGELAWDALAEFFTADAVFIDPAWGRVDGLPAITILLSESMAGLEDWTFPEAWTMVEDDRLVSFWWNRLGGARADGTPYQAPGISILEYASGGKFKSEQDILNMAHVGELIRESGWRPPARFNMPPKNPRRE
ncbi:MAG: nuclear transport factor 2 family protein [Deltaproteobacteria bacterium]|nr:nuclear transport factor 2 family protein [Deltaproteobacteria bacterium]